LDRNELKRLIEIRVADGSLLRLIGKCLHVGVLDGEQYSDPDLGTAQGSVLSPLLGNIYLHYVLDLVFSPVRLRALARRGGRWDSARLQRLRLPLHVDLGVAVGRLERDMPEPGADRVDVHASA
jgi:hypothetical protein